MSGPVAAQSTEPPLAIVCGGGALPFAVADAVVHRGRRVVLFPIKSWADPRSVERFPHRWIVLGQVGRFLRLAEQEGCRDVVMIGAVLRPSLLGIRLDWATVRMLPRIAR